MNFKKLLCILWTNKSIYFCKKRLIVCKKKFVLKLKTRYAETDQMGVIHHGSYATYLELARIEWLRSLGLSYAELEKQGILLPVLSLSIDYKHPLYFDDAIEIEICMNQEPSSILTFHTPYIIKTKYFVQLPKPDWLLSVLRPKKSCVVQRYLSMHLVIDPYFQNISI